MSIKTKKRLAWLTIPLVLVVGLLFMGQSFGGKYWLANNPNAQITNAEVTALGLLTQTEIEILDGATLSTDELNVLNSSGFWAGAPSQANNDMSVAFFYTEDFVPAIIDSGVGGPAAAQHTLSGWKTVGDATYDLLVAAGALGGWLQISGETASNNQIVMQLDALGSGTFVEATSASGNEWWLEFNFTPSSVTNAANWFVGLADEAACAADFFHDDGTDFGDDDFIGFAVLEADPNGLQAIWQTTGAEFDTCTSGTVNITAKNYTFGIHFDGATTVTYWVDGAVLCTQVITATGFPDTEELSPLISVKQGAADVTLNSDWIKMVGEK